MDQSRFEHGDLELLALGLLSADKEEYLQELIQKDPALQKEYLQIQLALEHMAFENAIPPQPKPSKVFEVFKNQNLLKIAAGVIVLFSLGYFYMSKSKVDNKEIAKIETNEANAISPFQMLEEELNSKEMALSSINYLHQELSKKPCEMNYSRFKQFLDSKKVEPTTVCDHLFAKGVHCDCEVLMKLHPDLADATFHHGGEIPPYKGPVITLGLILFF